MSKVPKIFVAVSVSFKKYAPIIIVSMKPNPTKGYAVDKGSLASTNIHTRATNAYNPRPNMTRGDVARVNNS
jgi:hypothetical protein